MNRCTHDRRGLLLGSRGCACTNRRAARRVHRISCRNEVYRMRERFGKRPTTQARWAAFSSPRLSREAKFGPSRFQTARGVNPDEWLGRGRDRSRKAVGLRAIWKLFRTKSASRKLNLTDLKLEDIATGVFTPVLARHSKSFRFIPKAPPTCATCDPIRPSPRTPRVFPRQSVPTLCCQPPERTDLLSVTICRAEAKISAQVNSIVGSDLYPV